MDETFQNIDTIDDVVCESEMDHSEALFPEVDQIKEDIDSNRNTTHHVQNLPANEFDDEIDLSIFNDDITDSPHDIIAVRFCSLFKISFSINIFFRAPFLKLQQTNRTISW